jgi:hypothetical protein
MQHISEDPVLSFLSKARHGLRISCPYSGQSERRHCSLTAAAVIRHIKPTGAMNSRHLQWFLSRSMMRQPQTSFASRLTHLCFAIWLLVISVWLCCFWRVIMWGQNWVECATAVCSSRSAVQNTRQRDFLTEVSFMHWQSFCNYDQILCGLFSSRKTRFEKGSTIRSWDICWSSPATNWLSHI